MLTVFMQKLTAELKIDRFYLRELAISNWTGTVGIESNSIAIKPFKLEINGHPLDFN